MSEQLKYLTSTTSLSLPTADEIACNRSNEKRRSGKRYDVIITYTEKEDGSDRRIVDMR